MIIHEYERPRTSSDSSLGCGSCLLRAASMLRAQTFSESTIPKVLLDFESRESAKIFETDLFF